MNVGILAEVTAQYFFYKVYFMYLLYILIMIVTGIRLKRCLTKTFPNECKNLTLIGHDDKYKGQLEYY